MLKTIKSYATSPSTWVIAAIGGVLALSFTFVAKALMPAANMVKTVANKVTPAA